MSKEINQLSSTGETEQIDATQEPFIEALGLELTPELTDIIAALKVALLEPSFDPNLLQQLWTDYAVGFETFTEQLESPELYTKAQVLAMLCKALLFRDTERKLRYLEELNKTEVYAANAGLDHLFELLCTELNTATAELAAGPERLILALRGKISDDNQVYLWDLWADEQDLEDLLNNAYEILLGEGEDPDEVLSELGILE
ncbi:MAG: hypothetical protein ABI303_04410 [Candidatus Saccharimonas sp.]